MKNITTLLLLFCATTFAQNTFIDPRDGKKYKTVNIGAQTWMARNLDYAGEDGDIGICSDNDPKNCEIYGRLYKWEDAMLACPDGWHLPTDEEWMALANFAGGLNTAGRKLKAKSGWEKWDCEWNAVDDRGRTTKLSKCNLDSYGFSALPSSSKSTFGDWWTATESHWGAIDTYMLFNSTEMMFQGKVWKMYQSNNNYSKTKTLSVRCLKGEGKLPSNLASKKTALATAEATKKAEKATEAANPLTTEVTDKGTILRGSTLARKLAWLDRSAESHNTYIIEVNADENIAPYTFEYKGAINITIILRGDYENRTIKLKSHGNMFTVKQDVTFILENNITLHGHNGNNGNIITVKGGALIMNEGVTITGNTTYGGVYVEKGSFEMNGGIISGNGKNTDFFGGGVDNRGTFIMNGGTISGNSAVSGGGVYVNNNGTFSMNGGTISGNNSRWGGGVCMQNGVFEMNGGIISNNTAEAGGGVHISSYQSAYNTFNMRGGTITSNTARVCGGGLDISLGRHVNFTKTRGTITGYNNDQSDGNVVKDEEGVIARRGHAVYATEKWHKETTTGHDDNLSCNPRSSLLDWDASNCAGAWDD